MDNICMDHVFGTMKYKHRWFKDEIISIFNRDYNIKIVAKAYFGKPITEQQRVSYLKFKNEYQDFINRVTNLMLSYVNDNAENLSLVWEGAKKIKSDNELQGLVKPTSLLIKQDGTTVMMFDCQWDEHGIGVQIIPDFQIGSQDIFL